MNGTNLQEALSLRDTLCSASTTVLETMFFTEGIPVQSAPTHVDPIACQLHASGAVNGTFSVAIDRAALVVLCESFYGDAPTSNQLFELLCEFTNMIAGSTLSLYSPSHFCPLSSPQLCAIAAHLEGFAQPDATLLSFAVDGGLISIAWSLRTK
jgi:hypothetical protein